MNNIRLIFIALAGVAFLIIGILAAYFSENNISLLEETPKEPVQTIAPPTKAQESGDDGEQIAALKEVIAKKDMRIADLEEALKNQEGSPNISKRLNVDIKPKKRFLMECADMEVGSWEFTGECSAFAKDSITSLVSKEERIIAVEIVPLVDFKPYGGGHPELKQEGLGGFRAKEAHAFAGDILKDTPIFTGLTLQLEDKRGFRVNYYEMERDRQP